MIPYYTDKYVTIYNSNALEVLKTLPDNSIQCCVTSPPYWGLRKYDGADVSLNSWKGQYGLEPTPEMYVEHTILFLNEIKRVLRKDGVCFWNLGDSYWGSQQGYGTKKPTPKQASNAGTLDTINSEREPLSRNKSHSVLKPKDLCLIPFRVAIAAQESGWWVRSVIIWSKPNPMPESVKDRPTNSHEYILMLTKSSKYYWDIEAVREPHTRNWWNESVNITGGECPDRNDGGNRQGNGNPAGRNILTVWSFPTQPYKEAHFAVFPEELPKRCILAATSAHGCCAKCGAPCERITESHRLNRTELPKDDVRYRPHTYNGAYGDINGKADAGYTETKTLGWQPSCKCDADIIPCIVLDPFAGSGTTGEVAKKYNRKAVLIEASEKYCGLIVDRVRQEVMELGI